MFRVKGHDVTSKTMLGSFPMGESIEKKRRKDKALFQSGVSLAFKY